MSGRNGGLLFSFSTPSLESVLIVGLSYGARNVLFLRLTYAATFPSIERQSYLPIKTHASSPGG